jgi:iron complex outermembrane recepter protein
MRSIFAVAALLLISPLAVAQVPDTVATLPEIRVEAARAVEIESAAPFALTVLRPHDFRTSSATSLQDIAARAPGLWLADRGHFALGERIVIRGVGARSPFGVRGIQLFYDGIPLTMPDGQAITDMVDPFMVRRVELIRGPSSVYWGNASGGTLAFSTEAPSETLLRASTGSFGRHYLGGRASFGTNDRSISAFLSHTGQDGFRENSMGRMTRGGLTSRLALDDRYSLRIVAAGALQDVRSPGSLTASEYLERPSAANPSYVSTSSGKWSRHLQSGVTLARLDDRSRFEFTSYGVLRDLENPLPFAFIDVSRRAGGMRTTYSRSVGTSEIAFGADVGHQSDDRVNYTNTGGNRSGDRRLDQNETVTAIGLSAFVRSSPLPRLQVNAGGRIDRMHYAMTDRIPGNEPGGDRTFAAVSPSASLAYRFDAGQIYLSAATSFEAPTTTELVNNPEMTPGFNQSLEPERTTSLETGVRYEFGSVTVDAAAFVARIENRISSYRTSEGGDRDFFRNSARGSHAGGELALGIDLPAHTSLYVSYAGLRAMVRDDDAETRLPAVPPHQLFAEVGWSPGSWRIGLTAEHAAAYFADDSNAHRIDRFNVVDLNLGYTASPISGVTVSPFVRLSNVLDERYVRSVVVNASFGRFYEPAPGRTFEAGLTVDL